jgi:hypothetical protein
LYESTKKLPGIWGRAVISSRRRNRVCVIKL